MYFHTDDPRTLQWLESVIQTAKRQGSSISLKVNSDNSLQVQRGGSMWCAPIDSTPDISRDASV